MSTKDNSIMKQTYVSMDLDKSLKKLACATNLTEAEIIRQALEKYIIEKLSLTVAEKDLFPLNLEGLGKTGPKDGARNHDKYIYARK